MRLAALFSGGKDSTFAIFLAKKLGYEISCLITIKSKNPESYMFHVPSISAVKKQAEVMNVPLIFKESEGEKEKELEDLKKALLEAKNKFKIDGVITGAVESVYQASRVQKICYELDIECFNPLWQKNQIELLEDLIKANFKVIITGVFAYPLDKRWLGTEITTKEFIENVRVLYENYKINPAGEGGEFETLVLNCPLFKRELKIINKKISGSKNSFKMEVELS